MGSPPHGRGSVRTRVVIRPRVRLSSGGLRVARLGGQGGCLLSTRGAARQRCTTGRCGGGSTSEAGRARPSHADRALAPSPRMFGFRTRNPGLHRGCSGGQAAAVAPQRSCPACPARQHRLRPYRMQRYRSQDGGPCSR